MESTNNSTERAQIAEHVVQRKIVGTLRNRKGTSIHERIMTVLATWAQQGLGQSADDEGEAERLNTYEKICFVSFHVPYTLLPISCLFTAGYFPFSQLSIFVFLQYSGSCLPSRRRIKYACAKYLKSVLIKSIPPNDKNHRI